MRIDKFIWNLWYGSRKQIHKFIKDWVIEVNNEPIFEKDYVIKIWDIVWIWDDEVEYRDFIYIILNKPNWYVSSNVDESIHKSYRHLLNDCSYINIINPVWRLDFDTEWLLFLTNDWELTHKIINAKKDILKKYYVEIEKNLSWRDIHRLEKWLKIDDYITKEAIIEVIWEKQIHISISEWKFHQVKKMLEAVENKVLYLKRISIWSLALWDLKLWKYRYLNNAEIGNLKELTNS